jgi:chromate reductase
VGLAAIIVLGHLLFGCWSAADYAHSPNQNDVILCPGVGLRPRDQEFATTKTFSDVKPSEEKRVTTHKVGYFVGSLTKASINRKLARALVRLAPPELDMSEISFGELPLYSADYDADYPPVARAYKESIASVNAVLFVTPEYNRSIPGALKNAIDWASRPYGSNAFARKPSAVIGTSPGAIGTAVGQQHLRSILGFCNSPQMNTPEAYIQFKPGLITDDGDVTNDGTREFLRTFMDEFHIFIARVRSVLPPNA